MSLSKMMGILAALTLAAVSLAQAAVIHVPGDYSTIQAAINAASPGDTVQVAAGIYHETATSWADLQITKSLALVGAGSGQTIVELRDTTQNGVEIRSTTSDLTVIVNGITFTKEPAKT